ncbi:hypothetical protein KAS41_01445 [Candidatus Parcubacteria bacterium]|nr:hypothetical protein [Candidatus Parcubacteria bacterium]
MATYKKITEYIKNNNGFTVKSCWIAHVKELYGLNPRIATNRIKLTKRTNPCPKNKKNLIKNAFSHFEMI